MYYAGWLCSSSAKITHIGVIVPHTIFALGHWVQSASLFSKVLKQKKKRRKFPFKRVLHLPCVCWRTLGFLIIKTSPTATLFMQESDKFMRIKDSASLTCNPTIVPVAGSAHPKRFMPGFGWQDHTVARRQSRSTVVNGNCCQTKHLHSVRALTRR